MDALLELRSVSAGYGPTTALHGFDLQVGRGDRLAVVGRNGAGKTTAFRAVMGLCGVRAGSIRFRGRDIVRLKTHERAAIGIGYVPQTRDIFPSLTVEENLIAGLKRRPRRALDEAYALFPRLAERRRNGGGELSGGEQQMLSVARALLGEPELLLLDEPLEGLAPLIRRELMLAFERLSIERSMTVVIAEQQVEEVLGKVRTAVVVERGRVVHAASAQALLDDRSVLERYVGVAVPQAETT